MFFRGSRYEYIQDAELTDASGRTYRYKRMRFIPQVQGALREAVRQDDRPDLLAFRLVGDPEQFWRLCDANRAQRPVDLTRIPGRRIRIPAPGSGG